MTTPSTPRDTPPVTPRVTAHVQPTTNGDEKQKERGAITRVLIYVVAAHLMAFYLFLMFTVIGKR